MGDQKREAPSAFCACSLCGETTAVYGFAEVVTARDGTSDTLPNEKGGSSGGQEKKKEGDDDVMEGGGGGVERLSSLSQTIRRWLEDEAASCWDASLRALAEQQAGEFFQQQKKKHKKSHVVESPSESMCSLRLCFTILYEWILL